MHSTDKIAAALLDTCHIGDARAVLGQMIADGITVQMCVTSPPYWGLRDYGCEGQIGLERTPDEYVAVLEQLRVSPHRGEMAGESGPAFEHYVRTDPSGVRPPPPELLETWLSRGWLTQPASCTHAPAPADILIDPFLGSDTTAEVAQRLGRHWLAAMQRRRTAQMALALQRQTEGLI